MKNTIFIALIIIIGSSYFNKGSSQACFAPWNASTQYGPGTSCGGGTPFQVSYNGRNYIARYCATGSTPDANSCCSWSNWIDNGVCAGCPTINPGSIGSDQSIPPNSTPSALTNSSAASGGDGTNYTYQWQISTNNSTWSDISGANSTGYSPGVLTANTYYRRKVTSGGCGDGFTSSVLITIISGSQGCFPVWSSSTQYGPGTTCGGSTPFQASYNGRNYTARYCNTNSRPDQNSTFSYDNWIDAGGCNSCNSVNPGSIGSAQSILTNTAPNALTNIASASGGNNVNYSYQWEISLNNITWSDISGATSTTYSPGVLTVNTYYRRRVTSAACGEGTSSSVLISIVIPIDSDNDGVFNHIDLDDDNDGILDTQECTSSNFQWSGIPTISGTTATGAIGNANYTYTSSVPVATTGDIYNHGVFPSSYGIPNTTSIQNSFISSNTLTFDRVIRDPVLVFASIGSGGNIVPIRFGSPIEVLFSTAVTQINAYEIRGEEGFAIVRLNGSFSQLSFDYLANEGYVNFYFGVDFTNNCDTDGDGIFNTLDLDSDGDGCPDAIEGGAAFTPSNLTSDRLSGSVDANGVPVLATASGQTIGTSTNALVNDPTCPPCPDNDADGVCDQIDLDDDNDGILDVAECPAGNFQWSTPPQVVSTNMATGTIHGFIDYTYTSDQPVQTEGVFQGIGSFPTQYNLVNGTNVMNTQVSSNTLVFSQPVTDPILAFGSIGAGGFPVGITFSNPIQLLWSQDVVQNSPTQITGSEGHTIIKLSGVFTTFSFNYLVSEFRVNFAFGSDFTNDCDIDNDGITNSFDLDSDADGCVDAIEGGAAFTTANLTSNRLSGSVNAQGVPVIATASGQAVGTSQNVNLLDASCPASLPIELLSFQATYDESSKTVLIKWATANENNNDYFTIERSVNGKDWQNLSIKKGAGNSSQALFYEMNDSSPFSDVSYYRLKQTDFDGQSSYSSVVVVYIKDINPNYTIYPNPASDFLTIFPSTNIKYVQVINSLGVLVATSEHSMDISISELPSGLYFVTIYNEKNEVTIKKVVITKK